MHVDIALQSSADSRDRRPASVPCSYSQTVSIQILNPTVHCLAYTYQTTHLDISYSCIPPSVDGEEMEEVQVRGRLVTSCNAKQTGLRWYKATKEEFKAERYIDLL